PRLENTRASPRTNTGRISSIKDALQPPLESAGRKHTKGDPASGENTPKVTERPAKTHQR
ncbi:hypothetical protein, partial [Arthrobacter bambusae]|uniref:hypothetical protein n=1 Tax=Arthrobacter bambusae TaxID=1338426 RepID=UPI0027D7D8AF